VVVGVQDLIEAFFFEDLIAVEREVIHPLYGEGFFENDIMLLKLETPSDQPYIRLNFDEDVPDVDERLTVVGFGDTEPLKLVQEFSLILKEVELGYISPMDCDLAYGYDLIQEHMMCTTTTDNKAPWYVLVG
jgi:hypothetical protein